MRIVNFVDEIMNGSSRKSRENKTIAASYVMLIGVVTLLWHHHSDRDFSFLLTFSGMLQCLGFFLLVHKMRTYKSANGLSSKTLQIYLLFFPCRLLSTMTKNGYLPVDSTGDWAYQACDLTSLMLVFQALFFIHKRYRATYQSDQDTMKVWQVVPALAVLACILHGDLNHHWFFDTVWTFSMYLDMIAMLPQLWMLVVKGGEVEAVTSHFVALLFFSRFLQFSFWWTGFRELAPQDGGFNKMGYLLCGGHAVSVLFSGDFMYHYFAHACKTCGVDNSNMVLPVGVVQDI